MADLTMQEIDGLETYALTEIRVCGPTVEVQISGKELFKLCHYARRGVEADAEIAQIRDALTGDDYASLPSDRPTVRMAHTIRADHDKFRNQVRDTCRRAETAEAALAEAVRREREEIAAMCMKMMSDASEISRPNGYMLIKAIRARKGEHDEH